MGDLYSWGANSHGQLGLGYESEQCITPESVQFPANVAEITSITGGGGHVMILHNDGVLYGCGWNSKGQLGTGTTENSWNFQQIPSDTFNHESITSVACGWETTAAVTVGGSLYCWGYNKFNQLGRCDEGNDCVTKPHRLTMPGGERCKAVAFNLRSTCVLTKNGSLYMFGKSRHLDELKKNNEFKLVQHNGMDYWKLNVPVDRMSAGKSHTIWQTNDGNVYGIGENRHNQTVPVNLDDDVLVLKSGWTHNAALTVKRKLWLWGRSNYGQLGLGLINDDKTGKQQESMAQPSEMECSNVKEFHLGAEHGLLRTKSGCLFTWGWNEHGNCGNGTTENLLKPVSIFPSRRCILAGCGSGFCYAIMEQ